MAQDVNSQIIDSVNSTMAQVVGHSSAESQGLLDTLMAETIGMAMYNAVTSQHNAQMVSTASVTAACARMLKIPLAVTPAVAVTQPVITGITSTVQGAAAGTVPASTEDQELQVTGQSFPTNPTVTIFDAKFHKVAELNGTAQLTNPSPTGCTIVTNAFATDNATYNVVIGNDAINSVPFQVTAETPSPGLEKVQLQNGKLSAMGSNFQPGMVLSLLNQHKEQLPDREAEDVTPGKANFTLPEGQGPGAYVMTARNPDGRSSAPLPFTLPNDPSLAVNLSAIPAPNPNLPPCDPAQTS